MVMNLKEKIISSLFFHLILFLLMIAVSSYTTGSGGLPNIIAVSLTTEDSKDLPSAGSDAVKEPPLASRPLSNDGVSLSDQAANKRPEESEKIPEPEKKAEAVTAPAKIENAEKPSVQRGEFTSPEDYHRFIMLHKKIFGQKAAARVSELLGEALEVNERVFYGGTAIVSLTFGSDRTLSGVVVDSASPELKAFFEELGWDAIPAPAPYLGNSLQIEFTVLEGQMSFRVNP